MTLIHIAPQTVELTPDELRRITKRKQHVAQARVLARLNIPFKRHPIDGSMVVGREAVNRSLLMATPSIESPGTGRPVAANGINWKTQAVA